MRAEAELVVREVAGDAPLTQTRTAFMRYAGQGYEIPVVIDDGPVTAELMKSGFEAAYRQLYGRTIPNTPIEVLTWAVRIAAPSKPVVRVTPAGVRRDIATSEGRSVFDASSGERCEYAIIDRQSLAAGDHVVGPALIMEAQTTTVISSVFDADIDSAGNIVLSRKEPTA